MRSQMSKRAFVIMTILACCGGWVYADVAATMNPAAIQSQNSGSNQSVGWRFFVDQEITITHLGLFDAGDNGLATPHKMGIWRVNKTGGLTLMREADIGPGMATEADHYVYVDIEDFQILPDPVPYEYTHPVTGVVTLFYERWLVGVWSASPSDTTIVWPRSAATMNIEQAGIIRFEAHTNAFATYPGTPSLYWAPWGGTTDSDHYCVNFKYQRPVPVAEAGPNVTIYSSEQGLAGTGEPLTMIPGTATDPYPGPEALTYCWLKDSVDGVVLQDWQSVGANGEANLNLAAPVPLFPIGTYTLVLKVTDGAFTVSDTMTLTVVNTPPEAQPGPDSQVVEINVDGILITAEVADFDGDPVVYQWLKGGEVLASGAVNPPAGGAVVVIPDLEIPAGDPRFPLGVHSVALAVNDGTNPVASISVTVEVKDTTAPTLAPTSSVNLLWPANHKLCPVTVWANAEDNGGGLIVVAATVESSEPDDGAGDGSTEEDCTVVSVDQQTIYLSLRAERSGTGDGRVYTIHITATDGSNNQSSADVKIRVPHDRKKK